MHQSREPIGRSHRKRILENALVEVGLLASKQGIVLPGIQELTRPFVSQELFEKQGLQR